MRGPQGGETQAQASVLDLGAGRVALGLGGELTRDQLVGLADGDQLFALEHFAAAGVGAGDGEVGFGLGQGGFGLAQFHGQGAGVELQQWLAFTHLVADFDRDRGHALAGEFDAQHHFLPGGDRTGGRDAAGQGLHGRLGHADAQRGRSGRGGVIGTAGGKEEAARKREQGSQGERRHWNFSPWGCEAAIVPEPRGVRMAGPVSVRLGLSRSGKLSQGRNS